jgi:hypothetical protein
MRWAENQNARRGREHAAAIDAWRREDADLRAMRQAATSFTGRGDDGSLPVSLRRDERVFLILAGVQSVEAPRAVGLPAVPTFMPVAGGAGPVPDGIRVRDSGTAVVTSRRLLFLGPGSNREWSFDKLTGLIHDPTAPMTLMQVSNRKTASGLVVPPAAATSFRFNLQLALADAVADRAGFVGSLDRLIAGHERTRPNPPIVAEPGQAPASAAWSPLRVVAAGAAVLALLICVSAAFLPGQARESTPPSDTAAKNIASAPVAPAIAAREPTPSSVPAPTATAVAPTAVVEVDPTTVEPRAKPKPVPKPRPKPRPKPLNLCGAPANPLGYTFCGGSLIRSPDSDACSYFDCIDAFWEGTGYMIQCSDGTVSMSGGRQGSCSHHGGNRRPVHHR